MQQNSPRYFFGLAPTGLLERQELKILLSKMKRTLADQEKDVRWIPPNLWHVTLLFLGALSESQCSEVLQRFNQWIPSIKQQNIELEFQGIGAFPSIEEARVLWLGLGRSQELVGLQNELQELFLQAGFSFEDREFRPHLSLVRFRNPTHVRDLTQLGGRKSFGNYKIGEIVFYKSVLEGKFPKYLPLARKTFADLHNT